VTDFQKIHAAAVEGEYDDEDAQPGFTPTPRRSAADEIREMQEAARRSFTRFQTLAGRYLIVGLALAAIGIFWNGPPAWLTDTEFWLGILLASRGLWCWEAAGRERVAAAFDPSEFLGSPDR
jgi:hypothetical protein